MSTTITVQATATRDEPEGLNPAVTVTPQRDWRYGLIECLSKIETLRLQMVGYRITTDSEAILDRLEAMVLLAEEFCKTLDLPDTAMQAQMSAMAKAGEFYAVLNDHRGKIPKSLIKSMLYKLSHSEDRVDYGTILDCMNVGMEALNAHFTLFTQLFPSSQKARGWVEAASAFLADFRVLIRGMQTLSTSDH